MIASDTRVGRIAGEGVEWIGTVLATRPSEEQRGLGPRPLARRDRRHLQQQQRPGARAHILPDDRQRHQLHGGSGRRARLHHRRGASGPIDPRGGLVRREGTEIKTVRGPQLVRKQLTAEEGGCKEGEVRKSDTGPAATAIVPAAFQASPAGTLVAIGPLCEKRSAGAEIWDKAGKSRIVDLSGSIKKLGLSPQLLRRQRG